MYIWQCFNLEAINRSILTKHHVFINIERTFLQTNLFSDDFLGSLISLISDKPIRPIRILFVSNQRK